MRETVAGVVVAALLGVACEGKTDASALAAAQATSPTGQSAAVALAPAGASAENPKSKTKKAIRVAKARNPSKEKKVRGTDAGEPRAFTLKLSQLPPSSY